MTEQKKRPGYLTQYARHAGITKTAAAEQLKRIGIDYMAEFDFEDADRRREAMRSAYRTQYAKPIFHDDSGDDEDQIGAATEKNPKVAESQALKEHYRAHLARLEFEQRTSRLVEKEAVEKEAFRIGRLVRDAIMNVPSRLAGILAAESDQRRVHDLLEKELRQALEALVSAERTVPA